MEPIEHAGSFCGRDARAVVTDTHPTVVQRHLDRLIGRAELSIRLLRAHVAEEGRVEAMAAGVNPLVVSKRLGHSTSTITHDLYRHLTPPLHEDTIEAFEAALFEHTP